MKKNDLTGQKFGRLTAKKEVGRSKQGYVLWECICECGNIKVARSSFLKNGMVKSCGCLLKESRYKNLNEKKEKHKDARKDNINRLYRIWSNMKNRCRDTYLNYGERGIKYCEEWENYENFKKWSLSNGYKDDLSIDRIDVNGNYEPNNCRWATSSEQANNKRNNHTIEYNGETKTLSEWSNITGIPTSTLYYRIINNTPKENLFLKTIPITPIRKIDLDGNLMKIYYSNEEIIKDGFSKKMILRCCNGKRSKYKNFKWEYGEEVLKVK